MKRPESLNWKATMNWPLNTTPQRDDDAKAGIEVTDDFQRFSQRNDIFTRAFWDDQVKSKHSDAFFDSYRMEFAPRRGAGFSQRDVALRNSIQRASYIIS